MTYGWREPAGAPLGGVELCAQCGFDARAVVDEVTEVDQVYAALEALLEHPYRDRRPDPETWYARIALAELPGDWDAGQPAR